MVEGERVWWEWLNNSHLLSLTGLCSLVPDGGWTALRPLLHVMANAGENPSFLQCAVIQTRPWSSKRCNRPLGYIWYICFFLVTFHVYSHKLYSALPTPPPYITHTFSLFCWYANRAHSRPSAGPFSTLSLLLTFLSSSPIRNAFPWCS